MRSSIFDEMIDVIRDEQQRRWEGIENATRNMEEEPPDFDAESFAEAQWEEFDAPLINELCMILLVALSHQVERDLVGLAARVDPGGAKEISVQQHRYNMSQLRSRDSKGRVRKTWDWEKINTLLHHKGYAEHKYIELLRHLSDSYKHNMEPSDELLDRLKIKKGITYAPSLPQSDAIREALAAFVKVQEAGYRTEYCDIAKRFVELASKFLSKVRSGKALKLSKVKGQGFYPFPA